MPLIDQLPPGLSLVALLDAHRESIQTLTGRWVSYHDAAIQLDQARGLRLGIRSRDPCGCPKCVKAFRDMEAELTAELDADIASVERELTTPDEVPLDQPVHLHSTECAPACELTAGEPGGFPLEGVITPTEDGGHLFIAVAAIKQRLSERFRRGECTRPKPVEAAAVEC